MTDASDWLRNARDGRKLLARAPRPPIHVPLFPMIKRLLLPLTGALLAAGSAAAQQLIVPGEVTRGALTSSDPRLPTGSHYDEWVFAGRRGETVIVSLQSTAFDAYLYLGSLRGGVFQELGRDDDGGNGTSSLLEMRLPEDGTYAIRVSSLGRRTGAYTLTLTGGRAVSDAGWYEPGPADRYEPPRRDGYVEAGRPVRARLTSSDPTLDNGAAFHLYTYAGRRAERVTITLRSLDFDAYLVMGTRGGRHGIGTVLARDDDGAGGRDARIQHVLPDDGEYVIRVNALLPATGGYTLEVESDLQGDLGNRPRPRPGDFEDDVDLDGIDWRLVGRWGLTAPGARVNQGDWSSISAGASMGILTIDESGAYTWRRSGRTIRGQLLPFTPRRAREPGTRYYAINDGRDEFYVFITEYRGERYMQVNRRGTDVVVAHGYRDGGFR